jgi:multidrug resistance efflux pump
MNIRNNFILFLALLINISCNKSRDKTSGSDQGSSDTQTFMSEQIQSVAGIGKIEPETRILSLAANRGGIITGILRHDGDRVKKGEAIIELDSETEAANLELIIARIRTLRNQIRLDSCNIKETEIKLADKVRLLESSRKLFINGAETGRNVDDLETEVSLLETALNKDKVNQAISESKLSELRAEQRLARIELDRRILTAPADGTILNISVTFGSSINQYAVYCDFAPDGRLIARCEVDEMFASYVKEGQDAKITLVGTSDVIATGKVIKAAPFLKSKSLFSELPGDREDRRVREVWVLLDDKKEFLYNFQVECIITI